MLEVDIQHRLGNFNLDVRFSVKSGLTALFGRSGAGKSTLFNLLAGLEHPDRGRIMVDGRAMFDGEAGVNIPPERRRMGYIFQEARLFPHMSVRANLVYGMNLTAPRDRHQDFGRIVEMLDLGSLLDRRPYSLSGGEKQRIAIGRALLASPRLLLMDEPLASLDAPRKSEILPFIERLRDELKLPIVYISHHLEEVIRLADEMVALSDGQVAASGPVEDIMSRLDLYPITGRYEAGAVLAAAVAGQDHAFGLTVLTFAGNRLLTPFIDLPKGTKIRVRVRARDVSLIQEKPAGVSILNIYQGVIKEIGPSEGSQADILIDIGVPLIARVTRKSICDLGLKPGSNAFAMVKAVAIDRHSLGGLAFKKHGG